MNPRRIDLSSKRIARLPVSDFAHANSIRFRLAPHSAASPGSAALVHGGPVTGGTKIRPRDLGYDL